MYSLIARALFAVYLHEQYCVINFILFYFQMRTVLQEEIAFETSLNEKNKIIPLFAHSEFFVREGPSRIRGNSCSFRS